MNKIDELKVWFQTQKDKTVNFEPIKRESVMKMNQSQGSRRSSVISQSSIQMLKKEDEAFKKGVETSKNILKNVKLMNMKLDDITDMVRLQRQKLLNMHKQIEKSQNYMNRSKELIRGFGKELYGDNIIKGLVILITIVLMFIMISAVKFKMRSELIISRESSNEFLDEEVFKKIDESMFWKLEKNLEVVAVIQKKDSTVYFLLQNFLLSQRNVYITHVVNAKEVRYQEAEKKKKYSTVTNQNAINKLNKENSKDLLEDGAKAISSQSVKAQNFRMV